MIFNDDSMLDFRGTGFGDSVMDAIFGFDAGEVVITGRVPGALYVEDFSEGEYGLQHIQPLEFAQGELNSLVAVDVTDVVDAAGTLEGSLVVEEPVGESSAEGLVAANDDDSPAALVSLSHGKSADPQVLFGGDSGDGVDALGLNAIDPFDLDIPAIPLLSTVEAPAVAVAAPTFDEDAPLMVGGRAYQSLSFLIIDTPFAVGDSQLTDYLRPSLNELLGLSAESGLGEDDGQAFVLPARSWLLH